MSTRRLIGLLAAASTLACSAPRAPEPPAPAPQGSALATCTVCHGDPSNGNAAPPRSVRGATDTTDLRVGAHQSHLKDGPLRQAIACSECHVVPATVDAPGHADSDVANLTWGPLASAGNVTLSPPNGPAPKEGALTCNVYCHGGAFAANDGALHNPSWTVVDGTQAGCGTCHGIPPLPPHPQVGANATTCSRCHPATINASGVIDVAGGKHINGVVDIAGQTCTACHGDPSRQPAVIAPAPPLDVEGNTATTFPGVGAHQAHLTGGPLSAPIACNQCHVVPTDTAHASQPLNLTFGTLATAGGSVSASFTTATLGCTNYCHGATLQGGALKTPIWTQGASQAACGSCHGVPPPSGDHVLHAVTLAFACGACHGLGYTSTTVVASQHVNGTVDVGGSSSVVTSYDPATRSCAPACHEARTWPSP